jgi:DNA polymerase/3'-5' exonuclease PolX
MKVFQLLFLLDKQLKEAQKASPNTIRFIVQAYTNVVIVIKNSHEGHSTINKSDIDLLPITQHMKSKLKFLLLQKINKTDENKIITLQLKNSLINIAGIGKTKADDLIKNGLKSMEELQQKKWQDQLTDGTKLLMKYKPLRKIPRVAIQKIESRLIGFKGASVKLVGSYLRHKPYSRDIDIMIVSNKKKILDEYVKYLKEDANFKSIHIYAQGADKMSLLVKSKTTYLKIDVFVSTAAQQHAMLLYSTGSKKFNINMRSIARRQGYLLNQRGLFKIGSSKPINIKSEKDIFKKLHMDYVPGQNR